VLVTREGSRFCLAAGDIALKIDASVGARIVEFSLSGQNVLTTESLHPACYGSTFWTSPQSAWGWPPPAEIDTDPYRPTVSDECVVFEGAPSCALGIAVTKSFHVGEDGVVGIEYTATNRGSTRTSLAPWEVTRVAHEGVTFFSCEARIEPPGARRPPDSARMGEILWIAHDRPAPEDQKLYATGSQGWLAHATSDFLFVKTFPVIAPDAVAPDEGEVEIFVNRSPRYVELEHQGAFAPLEPGAAVNWTVEWHLVALPADAAPVIGDPALFRFVESIFATKR
jgi:hypothetical protein